MRLAAVVVGSLIAVLTGGWLAIVTQPTTLVTTAWWPAAGIALGLGIRFPRKYVWFLALAVCLATLPISLWAGRPAPLAVALSIGAGIEMAIGTLILRGRDDRPPTLAHPRDIGRLLVAVMTSAVVYDLWSVGAAFALGDRAGAWTKLGISVPKHAAGMLLLTPLFMQHPRRPRHAGPFETAAQIAVTLTVAALVFVFNPGGLNAAFLTFVPLVWAALRMSTRLMLTEILAIAVLASLGIAQGLGPFSLQHLTPKTGSILLQMYELAMVIVFLALSLAVGQVRETALQLRQSEDVFRRIFDGSIAGNLVVSQDADGWIVERSNASAAAILPGLGEGHTRLTALMGESASTAISEKADGLAEGNAVLTVTTTEERILNLSMVPIDDGRERPVLALQFHDITEATRTHRLDEEELNQAGVVQRALLPAPIPDVPGWRSGAVSVPAKQVGGDFYDLRFKTHDAVVSLGDVMGKGIAAGMLAAATQTALRTNEIAMSPSSALAHAAGFLDEDLQRTSAFVTLAYVHVDLASGDYQFADAGHGLHFILRGRGGTVENVASGDMPIGIGDGWAENRGTLQPGDAFVLVSDGVLELWGGTLKELRDAVARCAGENRSDPQGLIDALCAAAVALSDRDDVTAVMLQRDCADGDAPTAIAVV